MQVSNNVAMFAQVCKYLTSDQIYSLFEDLLDEDVRDAIYNVASEEDPESPELARAAFNKLGEMFGIQSLINY